MRYKIAFCRGAEIGRDGNVTPIKDGRCVLIQLCERSWLMSSLVVCAHCGSSELPGCRASQSGAPCMALVIGKLNVLHEQGYLKNYSTISATGD